MIKYESIIEIKKTNILIDILLFLAISTSFFFTLNSEVNALIKKHLDTSPCAEFVYSKYTKENNTEIRIVNKRNTDKVFFNGVESRDSVNVSLQEGENRFIFTLAGKNKETDYTILIIKDTTPPALTTGFMFEDFITNQDKLTIEGTLSEESTVQINGKDCQVAGVTVKCTLELQNNTEVEVKVLDLAKNQTVKKFNVEIDREPPNIEVSAKSPTYQDRGLISIKGNEELKEVRVDGLTARVIDKQYHEAEVSLNVGRNTFKIEVSDLAGNIAGSEITIERQQTSPVNGQTSPGAGGGSDNGDSSPDPQPPGGGQEPPPADPCTSSQLVLYGVQTPRFAGETQTAKVKLTCSNNAPQVGKDISLVVRYSNGQTNTYTGTTNGSGIASFSWTVPDIPGQATVTGKYSYIQTSVQFDVY